MFTTEQQHIPDNIAPNEITNINQHMTFQIIFPMTHNMLFFFWSLHNSFLNYYNDLVSINKVTQKAD